MKYIFVCITFLFISANAFGYDVCVDGIFYNINNSTREASVTYRSSSYNSYAGKIIIPEEIHVNDKDYKVVKILNNAFSGCIELEEITIPSSITMIRHDAFYNCPKLKKIYFYCKEGEVEERAFKGATNIKEMHIKDLSDFMNVQFYGGNPVRTSHDLYLNGNLITELNIPESVTKIKDYAFQGCSVRSINFPETVKELGIASFSECNNLTTVILPPSLKTIANSSFSYCKNLTSVTIPRSVEKLEGAFENCKNLKKIICETEQVPVTDYMEFYQMSPL